MSDVPEPYADFADLRRVAIEYAQEASGEIWTDYNLHDPGVTLLEQTCFALSQIAYQIDMPTRDLLTNPRGHFCFNDLALFAPRRVLGSTPVTRDDLAAWMGACPEIDSAQFRAPDITRPGLYDVRLVPSQDVAQTEEPSIAFRRVFAKTRPLCTDLGQLHVASPIDVVLQGTLAITGETLPETVAASLYHRVADILSGIANHETSATRADVWEAPQDLLPPPNTPGGQPENLNPHLGTLRQLKGVRDIGQLQLTRRNPKEMDDSGQGFFRSVLPHTEDQIGITLNLNGAPVALDPARISEEYTRISAEAIASSVHHIDGPDWDVLKPGRRRNFTQSHVDDLLPAFYLANRSQLDDLDNDHHADRLFAQYRGAIDTVLKEMVADLGALPRIFSTRVQGAMDDPVVHRTRIQLLDYLIALQGVELPATRHSGLHKYRSVRARHRFEITWRLEYLFKLPWLHTARATGPNGEKPGGFMTELALLADFGASGDGDITRPMREYGLKLREEAELCEDREATDLVLFAADSAFDMLVPEDEDAKLLSPDELRDLSPFLRDGAISPAFFTRLCDSDSFALALGAKGIWQVLLDPGPQGPLRRIALLDDKHKAKETVVRLRATWRHLHRVAESAHLVERILLRVNGAHYVPNTADLVLPGWTARCRMQSYRSYVETHVDALSPAHIHVRVHWLDYAQMERFEHLKHASASGEAADLMALHAFLDDPAAGVET